MPIDLGIATPAVPRDPRALDDRFGKWAADLGVTVLGTHLGPTPEDVMPHAAELRERLAGWQLKALREGKERSDWNAPDTTYEGAAAGFLAALLDPGRSGEFLSALSAFVTRVAAAGAANSLAQLTLKLTAPGVPDIYQGTELWDLSLVDPDNRRPVDYARRRRLLAELERAKPAEIMARIDEGLPKLWLVRQTLHLRRRRPELFGPDGAYRPLAERGERAGHVVAFTRGERVVTVVPRLLMRLEGSWLDTTLELPAGRWHNELTGESAHGTVQIADLLATFPVALLSRDD